MDDMPDLEPMDDLPDLDPIDDMPPDLDPPDVDIPFSGKCEAGCVVLQFRPMTEKWPRDRPLLLLYRADNGKLTYSMAELSPSRGWVNKLNSGRIGVPIGWLDVTSVSHQSCL